MADRRGVYVAAFAASVVAVAAAYVSAFLPGGTPEWAPWLMATGIAGALASVMAVGAIRGGSLGPLGPVFLFVFVVLAGGFGAALLLEDGTLGSSGLWLGLPPPAAVILYGVGLLPLVLVPGAYALTFDDLTLGEEEWNRIRALRGEATSTRPPEGPARAAQDEDRAGSGGRAPTSDDGAGPGGSRPGSGPPAGGAG